MSISLLSFIQGVSYRKTQCLAVWRLAHILFTRMKMKYKVCHLSNERLVSIEIDRNSYLRLTYRWNAICGTTVELYGCGLQCILVGYQQWFFQVSRWKILQRSMHFFKHLHLNNERNNWFCRYIVVHQSNYWPESLLLVCFAFSSY